MRFTGTLYPHQRIIVDAVAASRVPGVAVRGPIGGGKTVAMIALLCENPLPAAGGANVGAAARQTVVVVCGGLVQAWEEMLARFAPEVRVFPVFDGKTAKKFMAAAATGNLDHFDVIVCKPGAFVCGGAKVDIMSTIAANTAPGSAHARVIYDNYDVGAAKQLRALQSVYVCSGDCGVDIATEFVMENVPELAPAILNNRCICDNHYGRLATITATLERFYRDSAKDAFQWTASGNIMRDFTGLYTQLKKHYDGVSDVLMRVGKSGRGATGMPGHEVLGMIYKRTAFSRIYDDVTGKCAYCDGGGSFDLCTACGAFLCGCCRCKCVGGGLFSLLNPTGVVMSQGLVDDRVRAAGKIICGVSPARSVQTPVLLRSIICGTAVVPGCDSTRAIVYSREITAQMWNALAEEYGKIFYTLRGAGAERMKILRNFSAGSGTVLLVSKLDECAGISIEAATDVIIAENVDKKVYSRIVGMAQTPARKHSLRVWTLFTV